MAAAVLRQRPNGVDLVRNWGVNLARTVHHPHNLAMVRLNRALGYVDASWPSPTDRSADTDAE